MKQSETSDIFRLIVEQVGDALIYADREGVIREWNAAAERLFEFERSAAVGQSLDLIIPERLRQAHWTGFDRAMRLGATRLGGQATVTKALTGSGKTIYVEMSFAVVAAGPDQVIGSVAMARDATQRHEREKALREQQARFDRSDPAAGK